MKHLFFCIFVLLSSSAIAGTQDSIKTTLYKRYSKSDFVKEQEDQKYIKKLIKSWIKISKSKNLDHKNNVIDDLIKELNGQHQELNSRTTLRNKQVSKQKSEIPSEEIDSLTYVEMPRSYNPEIKATLNQFTKEEVESRKSESALLSQYSSIIQEQNTIITNIKQLVPIKIDTSSNSISELNKNLNSFLNSMQAELDLLKSETDFSKK